MITSKVSATTASRINPNIVPLLNVYRSSNSCLRQYTVGGRRGRAGGCTASYNEGDVEMTRDIRV